MPLDHISISVPSDKHSQVVDFYKKLLKPMSYEVRMNFGQVVGMGSTEAGPTSIDFWIAATEGTATTAHLAFSAKGTTCLAHAVFCPHEIHAYCYK